MTNPSDTALAVFYYLQDQRGAPTTYRRIRAALELSADATADALDELTERQLILRTTGRGVQYVVRQKGQTGPELVTTSTAKQDVYGKVYTPSAVMVSRIEEAALQRKMYPSKAF